MAYVSRRYAGWFDGVDDYVKVQGSDEFRLNVFTIELYVRFLNPVADRAVFSLRNNSLQDVYGWCVRTSSSGGELLFSIGDGSSQAVYTTFYPERGKLYHIVYTYDGSKLSLYVDGSFVISANPPQIAYSGTEDIGIGALGDGVAPSEIEILKASIYNRALSDTEIAKLSEDPFDWNNVPKDGLVGAWDFNKADWTNAILPDLSDNGNDGQIYGVVQKTVLVKRGTGQLPKWDLKYGLILGWSKGDYVEWRGIQLGDAVANKSHSFYRVAKILVPTKGSNFSFAIKNYAKGGVGYYDSSTDTWRVDAGEKGYFAEKEVTDGGRFFRFYLDYVRVDDNSQAVPFARAEIVNTVTGEVVASHDYYANKWDTSTFKRGWQVGENEYVELIPYATYKVRLYSYGNIGFNAKIFYDDTFHTISMIFYDNASAQALQLKFQNLNNAYKHFYKRRNDGAFTYPVAYQYAGKHEAGRYSYDYIGFDFENVVYEAWGDGATSKKTSTWSNFDVSIGFRGYSWFRMPDNDIQREIYEFATLMLFDRLLSLDELQALQSREFVLDGLVHWWVVTEDGNIIDLVTGVEGTVYGNPILVEIYDVDGNLNNARDAMLLDIIKDERGM